ncbi:MAG: hypothetical protein OXU81_17390 [Gammaproteobacteria bacterium]|nr:hypothetical protein [Gammaproteobacteria bacterium]
MAASRQMLTRAINLGAGAAALIGGRPARSMGPRAELACCTGR